jgi:penicillin-binding protein 1A
VLAMVGGYDFARSQFNRAVQAYRQPGSAFKPIIYALAVESGMTPTSIVQDTPLTIQLPGGKTWKPENADGKYYGPITLREALTHSRNVVSVRMMEKLGTQKVCVYARRLGITSHLDCYLSLALGSSDITLLELTSVYGVFANGGIYTQPVFVTKIVDRRGKILEERHQEAWRVMSPDLAYMMTSLMESVVTDGTASNVSELDRPAAGKTGTTNEYHDAWFMGYTPELVTGVWVGIDDHSPIGPRETGGHAASPIWLDFMKEALKTRPIMDFPIPPGIRFVRAEEHGDPGTAWTDDDDPLFEAYIDGTHKEAIDSLESRLRSSRLRSAARVNAIARRTEPGGTPGDFRRFLDRLEREQRTVPAEGPEPEEFTDSESR